MMVADDQALDLGELPRGELPLRGGNEVAQLGGRREDLDAHVWGTAADLGLRVVEQDHRLHPYRRATAGKELFERREWLRELDVRGPMARVLQQSVPLVVPVVVVPRVPPPFPGNG